MHLLKTKEIFRKEKHDMSGAGAPGILRRKVKETIRQIKKEKEKKAKEEKNNMES